MQLFRQTSREQRFWRWFADNSGRLFHFETDQARVFRELAHELSRVEKGLTFEFGPVSNARREFTISADGNRTRFPAVQRLAAAAPPLSEWIIIPFRPPKDLRHFRSVRINNVTLSVNDIWFASDEADSRINLEIFIRGLNAHNQRELVVAAFLLLDLALGEYVVETRIGGVGWHALPLEPEAEHLLPFVKIVNVVKQPVH